MESGTGIVLIGCDRSDAAAAAIRSAGAVLAPRRAIVAHVWDSLAALLLHTDVDGLTGAMRGAAIELDEEERHDAERIAAEGAELAREAGFTAEPHALQGKPKAWPTLLAKADEIDAAAIVIGSRGEGEVKSALLGSVSAGLLHHTHRPVLVVPPNGDVTSTGPALIAFDGSQASCEAVTAAAELPAGRQAVVETVWMPYRGVAAGGAAGMPVAVVSRATEELDKDVRRRGRADRAGRRATGRLGRPRRPRRGRSGRRTGLGHAARQRGSAPLARHRRRRPRPRRGGDRRARRRLVRTRPPRRSPPARRPAARRRMTERIT
jgi:nucleotide-binding universal stress UspA family protein